MSQPFNLLHNPWITVENPDGQVSRQSIIGALLHAHEIATILDTPAATAGIYRLLTAVAQFALAPGSDDDLLALWRAGQFDSEQIETALAPFVARFDLFGPEPFYQSAALPEEPADLDKIDKISAKSAAYLWPEMAAGSNPRHWSAQRGDSAEHQTFCRPCAAAGLTMLPLFTSIGGVGYRPSINMTDLPVYLLPQGQTLYHSIIGGLIAGLNTAGAWWQRDAAVGRDELARLEGDLHGYTFMPRRVRLYPRPMYRACSRCGSETDDIGVETIAWGPGEYATNLQKSPDAWLDPLIGHRVHTAKNPDDPDGPPLPPRYFPVPPDEYAPWRSHSYLLLLHDNIRRPAVVEQAARLNLPLHWRAIAIRNRQAALLEWYDSGVIRAQLQLDGAPVSQLAKAAARSLANSAAGATRNKSSQATQRFFSLLDPEFSLLLRAGNYNRWGRAVVSAAQTAFRTATAGAPVSQREEARAALTRQTLGALKKFNQALSEDY